MSYEIAVQAALHGPELKKYSIVGHEFNVKAAELKLAGDQLVATGRISHCLAGQKDDQCDYTIQAARHSVLAIQSSYSDSNTVSTLFRAAHIGGSIVVSVFVPPLGAALLAATEPLAKSVEMINDLPSADWRSVCNNLVGLIAREVAYDFGRSGDWIHVGEPPENAVVGGHISNTKHPVYVGRAYDGDNLHPGKIAFYHGGWHCYLGNGGHEQVCDDYEILTAPPGAVGWSDVVSGAVPSAAVIGGHISDTEFPVYVGRATDVNGNVHPGKVAFYSGAWRCYIGNGGGEETHETYQVLVRI